ncbi:MAG: STAS domain-containing protein [Thermodesulfobacteriota bacterium]|nr:STAS domain-containing protein [Thermodesulfobacteriota bacterium]
MEVTGRKEGNTLVIEVTGRMDAATAPRFEKECNQWLEDGEDRIIVDFAGLEYISSAGLRGVLAVGKKLKSRGGVLCLCQMDGMVQEVFEISGFANIFPAFDTIEDALDEL